MDRILIYVVLGGGNDALNTIIPLDTINNNLYYTYRPTLGIANPIQLGSTDLGVHPSATSLKNMYDAGNAAIIQGVHYPNPNKSHFIGTDIKISLKDGNTSTETGAGFLGTWLYEKYPGYPGAFPNAIIEDPLGIALGNAPPQIAFIEGTEGIKMGLNLQGSPNNFRNLVLSVDQPSTNPLGLTASKRKIAKWYAADSSADNFSGAMANSWIAGENVVSYVSGKLQDQLMDVARMIKGGSKTQVYMVSMGGFDTHSSQISSGNSATGAHADLLQSAFGNIESFLADLNADSTALADRVLVQTFTEFGRQIAENGSLGTDHGTQCQTFVFGNGVEGGIYGSTPDLSNLTNNDYATYEFDYRQVLATTMSDWLGSGTNQLTALGLQSYTPVDFIKTSFKFPVADRDETYDE